MAARFWVGGTGTWDATDTTHWSATTGGAGGASVPTTADDVFLDASSGAGTISLSGAAAIKTLTATGYTGAITGGVTIVGSATLSAGMTTTGFSIGFGATATFTSAGKSLGTLTVNAPGGTVTLADACVVTGNVNLSGGTFDTNNQSLSMGSFTSTTASTRVLTLGSSAITLPGTGQVWLVSAAGLTLNKGTSTITMTGTNPIFSSGGMSYNNVVFSGNAQSQLGGGSTFVNLTYIGPANKVQGDLAISGSITVTGTFTLTGNSAVNRILLRTFTIGAQSTVTAAAVSLTNVDFMDWAGAGAAAPFTGTSLGDAGGNSGITFTASATQTWVGTAGGNWSDVTKWTSRVPLPQDDVVIASAFVAAQTITVDVLRLGRSISWAGVSGNPTWTQTAATTFYGSLTLAPGMTWTGSGGITAAGRSAYTITASGIAFPTGLSINAPGGTYTLNGGISGNAALTLGLFAGTLNTAAYPVTFGLFLSSGTTTRTLSLGATVMTLTGAGNVWVTTTVTGMTMTANTATVVFSGANAVAQSTVSLNHNGLSMVFSGGGTTMGISGTITLRNLTVLGTAAKTDIFNFYSSAFTATGTVTFRGNSAVNRLLVTTASGAGGGGANVSATATVGALAIAFVDFRDIVMAGTPWVGIPVTVNGNEVTDATRLAGLSLGTGASGQMLDGRQWDGSFLVHRAATNLFRYGQHDSLGANGPDYGLAGATATLDSTVPAPFGPTSVKVVTSNVASGEGISFRSVVGQAVPAGSPSVASAYFRGTAGQSYTASLIVTDTLGVDTVGTSTFFTATGEWQLLTPAPVTVPVGATGDWHRIRILLNGQRAETFWVAHGMIEKNQSVVAPYVATSGGAIATHASGRPQAPASLVSGGTFFVAARIRAEFAAADDMYGGGANGPHFFAYGQVDTNGYAKLFYREGDNSWYARRGNDVTSESSSVVSTHARGDFVTLIAVFTPTTTKLSVNGAAFVTSAATIQVTPTDLVVELGGGGLLGPQSNCETMWMLMGKGVPSDADAATINGFGNTDPGLHSLPVALQPTGAWTANIAAMQAIGSAAATVTASGNEITDATRTASFSLGILAAGQMIDGRTAESSYGIRRAATNLFRRGQCDATTDWLGQVSSTPSLDTTSPPPFSTQSIKVTRPGANFQEGIDAVTANGQAMAVGTSVVGSVYVKAPVGEPLACGVYVVNTDATTTFGATVNFLATGAWQLVAPAAVAVAAGKTGDLIGLRVRGQSVASAVPINVAHVMLEKGVAVVAPYVASSGGVTATHAAGRVTQFGPQLVSTQQGFLAMRCRMAVSSTAAAPSGLAFMSTSDGTGNNRYSVIYFPSNGSWELGHAGNGVGNFNTVSPGVTWLAGDLKTVILAWDATSIKVSIDGAAFQSIARTQTAARLTMVDWGTYIATRQFDGDAFWTLTGVGPVTNADAAAINALGNTDPVFAQIPATVAVTSTWAASTAAHQLAASTSLVGDALGNVGLIPDASIQQTWQGTAGGNWSDPTKWTSRVPLPQDDVRISSTFVATQTVSVDVPRMGRDIDFTGTVGPVTIANTTASLVYLFGSLTNNNQSNWTNASGTMILAGRGNHTITSAGRDHGFTWTIRAVTGSYTLADAYVGSGAITLDSGTFDTAGFAISTTSGFNSNGNLTRTLRMGASVWTVSNWTIGGVGLTIVPGTSLIDMTSTGVATTFAGGGFTYASVRYRPAGAFGLTITGNNTFASLDLEATTAKTVTLPAGGTQMVNGPLTVTGAAGQLLSFVSSTPGTATAINVASSGSVTQSNTSLSADVTITLWTAVGRSLTGTYSVRNTVGSSVAGSYTVIQQVGRSAGQGYSVLTSAGRSLSATYTVRTPVGRSLGMAYSTLILVGRSLGSQYSILILVGRSLGGSYSTLTPAGRSLSGSYVVRTPIGRSAGSVYTVRTLVGRSLGAQYSTLNIVGRSLGAGYSTLTPVGRSAGTPYIVRMLVGRSLGMSWIVIGRVARSLPMRYYVRRFASHDPLLVSIGYPANVVALRRWVTETEPKFPVNEVVVL